MRSDNNIVIVLLFTNNVFITIFLNHQRLRNRHYNAMKHIDDSIDSRVDSTPTNAQ